MTTTTNPPTVNTTAIDDYIAAWNETDEAKRHELLAGSVSEGLWYRDPMLEADSREAFCGVLGFVQQNFPGHMLTRTSDVDAHHDLVRFNWALGRAGEAPVFAGVDIAKFDAEGRLSHIIGFAGEAVA